LTDEPCRHTREIAKQVLARIRVTRQDGDDKTQAYIPTRREEERLRLEEESMILTREMTEEQARLAVAAYLAQVLGPQYSTGPSHLRQGRLCFMVKCRREDMHRQPAVGAIAVDLTTGQVEELTAEQLRDMREMAAVQAAQERKTFAKDNQGYILRQHARIKASVWLGNQIDLKVGASGGAFLPMAPPRWRFSIDFHQDERHLEPLGIIDVDAQTGQVMPLTAEQILTIQECVRAAQRLQPLATTP